MINDLFPRWTGNYDGYHKYQQCTATLLNICITVGFFLIFFYLSGRVKQTNDCNYNKCRTLTKIHNNHNVAFWYGVQLSK